MIEEEQEKMHIRKARPEDADEIASVMHQSFLEYKSFYTREAFEATTPGSDKVLERMNEGPMWVAVQRDRVVGTASAVAKGTGLYVRGMAVHPEARGQKIGWLLLEHMESFANENGVHRMFLSTTPFLARAIRLYERVGFRRTDEGPHDLLGTQLYTMAKDLKAAPPESP